MTKNILFDLNGIFIQSPYLTDRFRDGFGVAEEASMRALKEVMAQIRLPDAVSAYDAWRPYLVEWGISMDEEQLHDFWFGAETENIEMVRLAKKLKKAEHVLYILSNNFKERAEYYERTFDFMRPGADLFTKIYYSWQTGFVKPDKEAFENFLKKEKLDASDCVFFDDSQRNVTAAQGAGIRSYVYSSPIEVEAKL